MRPTRAFGAPHQESVPPPCPVADDPAYAYSRENPVRIGGGARTVAARERRYLDALRGPEGQTITYRRLGSGQGPDGTILDIYEATYEGIEEPVRLYLDAYHWADPQVPQGLRCGRPIGLPVPAPDPFGVAEDPPDGTRPTGPIGYSASRPGLDPNVLTETDERFNELAIAYALEGRRLEPIPLDADRPELGVGFDPFHRKVLRANEEAAAGGMPDLPIEMGPRVDPGDGITIVAYPFDCGGRAVRPREIAYVGMTRPGQTGEVIMTRGAMTGAQITAYLPGFEAPQGALGASFFPRQFNRGDAVVIRYQGEPCEGVGAEIRLPVRMQLPRPLEQAHAPQAQGPPATVLVRAIIDVDGVPRQIVAQDGPSGLHEEAVRLAGEWRWRPQQINGTPVPLAIGFQIRFGSQH